MGSRGREETLRTRRGATPAAGPGACDSPTGSRERLCRTRCDGERPLIELDQHAHPSLKPGRCIESRGLRQRFRRRRRTPSETVERSAEVDVGEFPRRVLEKVCAQGLAGWKSAMFATLAPHRGATVLIVLMVGVRAVAPPPFQHDAMDAGGSGGIREPRELGAE